MVVRIYSVFILIGARKTQYVFFIVKYENRKRLGNDMQL
jgi:hypothetical protein